MPHLPLDVRQGCLDSPHQEVGEPTREVWDAEEGGGEAFEDRLLPEEDGLRAQGLLVVHACDGIRLCSSIYTRQTERQAETGY